MPLYEYRCRNCGRRSSFLKSISDPALPSCPRCRSSDLVRLISRVSLLRSEESRLESLADPSHLSDLDENDPKSMARWMKRMGREMGEDVGPEFDEAIEQMESGEPPEPSQDATDSEATSSP